MKNLIVFCGSGEAKQPIYREQAYLLGEMLAKRKIHTIYGGAKVGLMGALADGVLNKKGRITGIIPTFLKTVEIAHEGLTELIVVNSMHDRKLKMFEMCDGIVALPGGWGTMDELFEMLTWGQLGLHSKPIGILNINGFYNPLISLCSNMVEDGFLKEDNLRNLLVSDSLQGLLIHMENFVPNENVPLITKQTT